MQLDIIKKSAFAWKFDVVHDGDPVATIDLKAFREGAVIDIKGESFKVGREGLTSGPFFIEAYGTRLAEADKPSALTRRFVIGFADRHFKLEAQSALRRTFVAIETTQNGAAELTREIARIEPVKWYSQSATGRFDDELPVALDVFLISLTLLMWKRAADST